MLEVHIEESVVSEDVIGAIEAADAKRAIVDDAGEGLPKDMNVDQRAADGPAGGTAREGVVTCSALPEDVATVDVVAGDVTTGEAEEPMAAEPGAANPSSWRCLWNYCYS